MIKIYLLVLLMDGSFVGVANSYPHMSSSYRPNINYPTCKQLAYQTAKQVDSDVKQEVKEIHYSCVREEEA